MSYKPLRKDLTETSSKCFFCPRHMTSLKAYVLENIHTGEVVLAGPTCAQNNLAQGQTLNGIPDLTKFTQPNGTGIPGVGGGGGGNIGQGTNSDLKRAVEYLELREGKLAQRLNCSYTVLRNYYNFLATRQLTVNEVNHVNNIENQAPKSLTLSELQRCYNYLFWIDIAIEQLPDTKTGFLKDIQKKVIKGIGLTKSQLGAVNKWLENIEGVPCLK